MDPMRRDITAMAAAVAHEDAHGAVSQLEAAERHGRSDRTMRYWSTEGPPPMRQWAEYISRVPDPWRVAQWGIVEAKRATVCRLDDAGLIERIRDLRAYEKSVEASDNTLDALGCPLMESAAEKQRDAAINAELAACLMEAAARPRVRHALERGR
jgi:hypothetical protein